MELADFPSHGSLSSLISPACRLLVAGERPYALSLGGKPLNSVYLVLLALNEECRDIGQGAFYHLPLRGRGHDAHPCDVIYLPDSWNQHDQRAWDQASWCERLEMCTMEGRIEVNEDVLPICVRVLQFGDDSPGHAGIIDRRDSLDSGYGSRPSTSVDTDSNSDWMAIGCLLPRKGKSYARGITTQHDPAFKPNTYCYSRPMEDISTYLILYTSHQSTPILCPTAAFEHTSICGRRPTPGDFSETYEYGLDATDVTTTRCTTPAKTKAEEKIAGLALQHVMMSGMSSNRELVERVWEAWHEKFSTKGELERDWLGRVKYSWQEVKSIIEGRRLADRELPMGWPKHE